MNEITLSEQNYLLQNRIRIRTILEQYPHVINVGVGLKETGDQLTSILCYRVYVAEKKPLATLQPHEVIPPLIEDFITDVIPYGIVEEAALDKDPYRPLIGGIMIKTGGFADNGSARGAGTLGCLALLDDGSNKIVALTNEHVVRLNTSVENAVGIEIGQPWKEICCCCCTKNVIGKVLKAVKRPDCAIIELDSDIVNEILAGGKQNEILTIGKIKGRADAMVTMPVQKMGAATGLTEGIIVDVAFDDDQLLITDNERFAGPGDSGSIVLTLDNRVVGLLWGTERNRFKSHIPGVPDEPSTDIPDRLKRRLHGVAAPIKAVEEALGITTFKKPATATISVHGSDTQTFVVPNTRPNPRLHFVTIHGEGDIILQATFTEPIANERISWASDNEDIEFPAIGTDNTTAKIGRNDPEGRRSIIRVKVDGMDASDDAIVWIVWTKVDPNDVHIGDLTIDVGVDVTRIDYTENRQFTILPEWIIPSNPDQEDVPDLRGPNTIPPPDVPATDGNVYAKGVDLSRSARYKWDATRRIRFKAIPSQFAPMPPQFKYNHTFLDFPGLPLVGNDEEEESILYGDPYTGEGFTDKGKMYIDTAVMHIMSNDIGAMDDKVTYSIHFQLFARLELAGEWRMISDPVLFRVLIKLRNASEIKDNKDYNNDSIKISTCWIDDGSDVFANNDDF